MCMSLPIPLPGLHSGLDSLRFCTITIAQPTIYCRQHSMAQSVPLHCWLLPNTVLCGPGSARSRSGARSGAARASHSGRKALLIKWKASTIAVNGVKPAPWPTAASVSASSLSSAAAAKVSSVNSGTSPSSHISSTCKQNGQKQQVTKNWADREHILVGPLALSMTSSMDANGHYRWPHRWTHRGKGTYRATCTIDDLIDGRKRALSMTSSMDAQTEREGTQAHKTGFVKRFHLGVGIHCK